MTASLKTRNGIWQMIFSYKDSSGKWKQKSESTGLAERGNKRKAQQMLEERKVELQKQSEPMLSNRNILFLNAMWEWLTDVMVTQVREYTLFQYKRVFEYHIKTYEPFNGLLLQELTPRILQGYYNSKVKTGLSPNTLHKHHGNIHKFLRYALSLDMINSNPAERVTLPKKIKSNVGKVYSATQLQQLCHLFWNDPIETAVLLTATYGLRRSEVCGLQWDAVDFDAHRFCVCSTAISVSGKTIYSDNTKSQASRRTLPLGDYVYEHLKHLKRRQEELKQLLGSGYNDSGFVCAREDGKPIDPNFVSHHFARTLKTSELPYIRFHDLRHSVATLLHDGGRDMKDIQGWLGHSDIATTANIYAHLQQKSMDDMAKLVNDALQPTPLAM